MRVMNSMKRNEVKNMKGDVINRLIASTYIIEGVIKELGEDSPIFVTHCQNYENLSEAIIAAYQKLNFRERSMMAAKMGFDMNTFAPKEKLPYCTICYFHELSSAETASRTVRKALRKVSMQITSGSRGDV